MQNLNQNFQKLVKLVENKRGRESESNLSKSKMSAIESDKGRIINSSAFRRLQQKAQVFSLETNAAVRTRLTHSFEVAQIGRFIAQEILNKVSAQEVSISYEDAFAITTLVENACLLHDIGNPPFGHLGEAAIQKWFATYSEHHEDKEQSLKELKFFDGNAQGLRLVCFLSGNDEYGLNLTYSTLLSMVKYPKLLGIKENSKGLFSKDFVYCYEQGCEKLEWEKGKVFPFAILMNISDDIAYSMSDIEDGIEKKIINEKDIKELVEQLNNFLSNAEVTLISEQSVDEKLVYYFIQKIKTQLINHCVREAANIFVSNLNVILNGEFTFDNYLDEDLNKSNEYNILNILKVIKSFSKRRIYAHESVERIELAGDKILKGLLNIYEPILELSEENFGVLIDYKYGNDEEVRDKFKVIKKHNLHYESRLFNTIPRNYVMRYQKAIKYFEKNTEQNFNMNDEQIEFNLRCHILVDYISGMTDDFALERYNLLSGHAIK